MRDVNEKKGVKKDLSEGEGKDEALSIEALDIFQKEGKRKEGGATDWNKMSA
jgi:hypothetical protein